MNKPRSKPNPATERARQARLRERRKAEGWRRLTLWVTPSDAEAIAGLGGEPWLGRAVKALLCDCMTERTKPTPKAPEAVPDNVVCLVETVPDTTPNHAALMQEFDRLKTQGLSDVQIAVQFNERGWRTGRGKEFFGGNLKRDWRKWKGE
ncbi:hypothetical protein CCP4SC76_4720006 [Gammaproteobacteria bacterium]